MPASVAQSEEEVYRTAGHVDFADVLDRCRLLVDGEDSGFHEALDRNHGVAGRRALSTDVRSEATTPYLVMAGQSLEYVVGAAGAVRNPAVRPENDL